MEDVGIMKGAGLSWVTVKNKVHIFRAKVTEKNGEIQAMLVKLRAEMQSDDYKPDTIYSLHDIEEEKKTTAVGHHSEESALAFTLIAIPPGVNPQESQKFSGYVVIVMVPSSFSQAGFAGREITFRENKTFHRFRDSECSCRDFW